MRQLLLLLALLLPALAAAGSDDEADLPGGDSGRYLLMDVGGRAVSNQDFPGRLQLIAFGYTFCPDVCPTTLAEMAVILKRLGKDAERLQVLFVTLDPERDTAGMLHAYVTFFDPRMIGLTGPQALVKAAADNFRVRFEKVSEPEAPPEQYAVDHSAGMYLLGPDGRYVRKFAYATPPAEIAERIREIIASTEFSAGGGRARPLRQ